MYHLTDDATSFAPSADHPPAHENHVLNPLRALVSGDNISDAAVNIRKAILYAKQAADPVFLAVPMGMPHEQAVMSANRYTRHLEPAAKAVAYLNLAWKYVSSY